jgi:succinyl-diaminopimelate desuccinylase
MTIDWKALAEEQREAFLRDLQAFLAINSIEDMATSAAVAPFGTGVAEALNFMLNKGRQDGFVVQDFDGYAGTIDYGESEERIGVLAHVDVVPVGDGWTTPPFTPAIRDGRIYARGAIDDKGPLLAAYYGMNIVRRLGLPLSKTVRFIVGTDEESGWLCMKHYGECAAFPEVGFSPDADFPIVHAEKGQINPTLSLTNQEPRGDISHEEYTLIRFLAGERVNMVPDNAEAVVQVPLSGAHQLDNLQAQFARFASAEGVSGEMEQFTNKNQVVFRLQGKAAHGMIPFEGVNAGLKLAIFLSGLPFAETDRAFLEFLSSTLDDDFYGENLGIACEDEVTGPLTVNAGVLRYDAVDGTSEVKLNIRYPATHRPEPSVNRLRDVTGALGWSMPEVRTSTSHHVPKDHPIIENLQRVYAAQTGQEPVLLTTGGATYAKSMKYGVAFGAEFPRRETMAHMKDEYAVIDDLILAISIYAQAIYELAK